MFSAGASSSAATEHLDYISDADSIYGDSEDEVQVLDDDDYMEFVANLPINTATSTLFPCAAPLMGNTDTAMHSMGVEQHQQKNHSMWVASVEGSAAVPVTGQCDDTNDGVLLSQPD